MLTALCGRVVHKAALMLGAAEEEALAPAWSALDSTERKPVDGKGGERRQTWFLRTAGKARRAVWALC